MTHPYELGYRAGEDPDHAAVIMAGSGAVTTYGQLDERSNRLAHVMRRAGLSTGDHIALLMENSSALLEVAWAAQRSGLYYTALNSHLRRSEAQHILDDCGARGCWSSPDGSRPTRRDPRSGAGSTSAWWPTARPTGSSRTTRCWPGASADPIADEAEGREMLYSSGTTGRTQRRAQDLLRRPARRSRRRPRC